MIIAGNENEMKAVHEVRNISHAYIHFNKSKNIATVYAKIYVWLRFIPLTGQCCQCNEIQSCF